MRILFIGNTRIGDFILSSGIIAHLLKQHPECRLTIVCGPTCVVLTRNIPNVVEVIPLTKKTYNRHWFDLWKKVISTKWDLVVDLRNSAISRTVLASRTLRLQRLPKLHKVEEVWRTMGVGKPAEPRVWIGAEDRDFATKVLGDADRFIVIGPGASLAHKTWSSDRFAELAVRLVSVNGPLHGARVVLLGAPNERPAAEPILRSLPKSIVIDLMDKADLLQAGAVIERASLYIGNDNGQMHLAAATGAPTLGLFGPTSAEKYRPWGERCCAVVADRLEGYVPTQGNSIMDGLSVEKVFHAACGVVLGRHEHVSSATNSGRH